MKQKIIKHALIIQSENPKTHLVVEDICNYLSSRGITVNVLNTYFKKLHDPQMCKDKHGDVIYDHAEEKDKHVDIVFAVGGDGTALQAGRMCAGRDAPILAVNVGHFGFINEIQDDEWKYEFELFEKGEACLISRSLIKVDMDSKSWIAMNDVTISSREYGTIRINVFCDDVFLTQYRCDGLLVSTPTGSTAHSLAVGGPIFMPSMKTMLINPIAAFTISHRALVLPMSTKIRVELDTEQRNNGLVLVDGRGISVEMKPSMSCVITDSEKHVKILASSKRSYFEVLRDKLNWSGTFR